MLFFQTKLHDDLCAKRTTATIATHDVQLLKAPLIYDVKSPTQLKVCEHRLVGSVFSNFNPILMPARH